MIDIKILFLGTASAQPSKSRNQSSLGIQLSNQWYIFDAGEATQHQIMRQSIIKLGKIRNIFITHLHGDHIFGLVGLICTILQHVEETFILNIYGPSGTASFIRNGLTSSFSKLCATYRVYELVSSDYVEQETILYNDELPTVWIRKKNEVWNVLEDEFCIIKAGTVVHTVPCLGYVLQEHDSQGKLLIEKLRPELKQFEEEFASAAVNPMNLLSSFKKGIPIELPNHKLLQPVDFMSSKVPGRKIVILGDTSDPSAIESLCQNATVLIHEATNSYLEEDHGITYEAFEEKTISHGHSTPQMAAKFAKKVGATALILSHFSSRYKGDQSPESLRVMENIRQQAVQVFGTEKVYCAYDYFEFPIQKTLRL